MDRCNHPGCDSYIGSNMVKRLGQLGCSVTTLDNLSSGHRDAVLCGDFVHGDIADRALLDDFFSRSRFDAVMHFASFIQVGESVQHPAKYYQNNVVNTLNLLNAMQAFGVSRFIFSSSNGSTCRTLPWKKPCTTCRYFETLQA